LSTLTVSSGGINVIGNSQISGSLSSLTGLSSSGTITFSDLTANRLITTTTGGELSNSITSSNLRSSVSGVTGSGNLVFGTSPTFLGDINLPGGIWKTDGAVGVGTSSPSAKIEINEVMSDYAVAYTSPHLNLGASDTVDNTGFVGITYDTSTSANYGWSSGALRSTSGQGDFVWKFHSSDVAGSERMRITSAGNVGIGTINPTEKLEVSGNFKVSGTIISSGGVTFSDLTASRLVATDASKKLVSTISSSNLRSSVSGVTGSGNLVFGTSPTLSTLTVSSGGISVTGNSQISGTLSSLTGLTSSGTVTFSGLTANRLVTTTTGGQLTNTISSSNLRSSVSDETGSGNLVFSISPSLTTPNIGVATGTSLGLTGSLSANTLDIGSGDFIVNADGDLLIKGDLTMDGGDINLATATEIDGNFLPTTTGLFDIGSTTKKWRNAYFSGSVNMGSGVTLSDLTASRLVATDASKTLVSTLTSANLRSSITGTTGSGNLVFATSPSLTTPNIGAASGSSLSLTGDLTVGGKDIYGGGSGTSGIWRYSTGYPNHGIFYVDDTSDSISISPSGGGTSTPDLKIVGNGDVIVKDDLTVGGNDILDSSSTARVSFSGTNVIITIG
jgi:protein involved in ribonucleotide reduction